MLGEEHVDYSISDFGSFYILCARELPGFSCGHNKKGLIMYFSTFCKKCTLIMSFKQRIATYVFLSQTESFCYHGTKTN